MNTKFSQATRWVRRFDAPGVAGVSDVRLLCLPHAGGSASFYAPLAEALRGRVSVAAIQYPGRQDRFVEPCIDSIQELADEAVGAIEDWVRRPFALFGHSMGGAVAYEVAARLEATGQPPVALFISGSPGPLASREERMHLLEDDVFVDELVRLGATDRKMLADKDMRAIVLPMIRADYRAIETYRCAKPYTLTCPVTVLLGNEDSYVTQQEAARWREHTGGEFNLRVFPGGHFYLLDHLDAVATVIADSLAIRLG